MRLFRSSAAWICIAALGWTVLLPEIRAASFFPGISPTNVIWPGGTIPYLFDTNYPCTPQQQAVYLDVMREWELAAKIHLVPYTGQSNYLLLQYNPTLGSGFCLLGTPVTVSISTFSRGYAHEMGHALGFAHEHQRLDRDNYITVNFSNILGYGTTNNPENSAFVVETNDPVYGNYDFESIMHYYRNSFSYTNSLDVIDPLPAYAQKYYYRIGGVCLSVGDFAAAAYLYGAPTTPLTNMVTNTLDAGPGTLRAAIYYANINPGATIRFNISTNDPGYSNGVWTIHTTGELPPVVANGTVIDGTTQPTFTNHPVIFLDGSEVLATAGTSSGLYVYQANCVIKDIGFDNFTAYGMAFETYSATNNVLENCYVGLDGTGSHAAPNAYAGAAALEGAHSNIFGPGNVVSGNASYGILISDTNSGGNIIQGNYIGLDASGSFGVSNASAGVGLWDLVSNTIIGGTSAASRNVISGNGLLGGVYITGSNNSGTVIQGNYIGPAANGMASVTNDQPGIYVELGPQNVTIGGTNAGAGNVISGNQQDGILYYAPGTNPGSLMGNLIGTDRTGTNALGNYYNGIDITYLTQNLVVGGVSPAARNVISGNGDSGIVISDSGTSNITIIGNYVGVATNGTLAVGNAGSGIYVTQGPANITIGGTTAGTPNLVSGNGSDGVSVYEGAPNSISILGNVIGADKTGMVAIPNENGISLEGGTQGMVIGGTTVAARNLISGNRGQGVIISDATTSGNSVLGNYIGVATNGTSALGNGSFGVYLYFAPSNMIGGIVAGSSNVISANSSDGVLIYGNTAFSNVVQGNYIGVDRTGEAALGNVGVGISLVAAASNTIGGIAAGAGNLISGNASHGIGLYDDGTSGNVVQGNYLGVDKTGLSGLPNGGCGILLSGGPAANQIGGTTAAARNVVGASGQSGLYLWGPGTANNVVQGNYFGVNATGNTALSNANYGATVSGGASSNTIGGAAGAGNVISACAWQAVYISDTNTTGNVLQGNFIGVGANGTTPIPNASQGFWIQNAASNNIIGLNPAGGGTGNIIAYSAFEGIIMWDTNTVGNSLRGNLIYSNGNLGINLVGGTEDSFGTTLNHSGGAVPGPNDLQNYPVITAATDSGAETTVAGTLNSTANRLFALDFFQDATPDRSGHGQGRVYEGSTSVMTASSGNASFSYTFNHGAANQYYTVLATDQVTGDTSEFSADVQSTNAPSPPIIRGPFTYSSVTGFSMDVAVSAGQGYQVQAATNLPTTNWVNLTNFTATSTNFAFTDRTATNLARRFYRVVSP